MKNLITLFISLFLVSSISFAQTKKEKKQLKEEQKVQGFEEMKTLIDSNTFEFIGEWAISHRGRRINLITNPTFLRMNNQEADAFFPFFGERYSGAGAYGSDSGGIEFKTEVTNYDVSYIDKKKQVRIKFNAPGKGEKFEITMLVFSNGNASVTITSNNRSIMKYDGSVKELEVKETEN